MMGGLITRNKSMTNEVQGITYELRNKLEKQADRIELLEEELRCANEALEEKSVFAAALEQDLENAIIQLQKTFFAKQVN